MELEVPKRFIFMSTLSNRLQGERQKRFSRLQKLGDQSKEIPF